MEKWEVAVNGVQLAAQILEIKAPEVSFFNNEEITKKGVNAIFFKSEYGISFDETWVNGASDLEIMVTCLHETRHAFQYLVITNRYKGKEDVDESVVMSWAKEFNGYKSPLNCVSGDRDYLMQDIEVDAIRFSSVYMKKLYQVKREFLV